jgi:DNA end-binding protein Ku
LIDGAMARAIWRGAISFGLVTIPVQLVSAVGRQRPRFHLLHEKDESPVRYDRVCQRESRAVPWDQIVKGFEVEKGRYTVLTKEDFRKAAVERSDAIDVLTFVEHDAIDPRFFETPYYLQPASAAAGHAYGLLREAMRAVGRVGVAQIIMRQEQHMAALWVKDKALVLSMLRFAAEIADVGGLSLPAERALAKNELTMATRLVESFAGAWKPEQYKDRYTANLLAIIAAKEKGRKPRLGAIGPAAPEGKVVDLMERLRASLAAQGGRAPARRAARPAPARKATRPAPARAASTSRRRTRSSRGGGRHKAA